MDDSVSQWIAELKSGDEEAARRLWDRYFHRVVELARLRLGEANRKSADEEDVGLSVFHSLCQGAARGKFPDLKDRDGLWRLLVDVTRKKSIDLIRRNLRQKRGGGELRGESVFAGGGVASLAPGIGNVAGDELPPEAVAMLDETLQRLTAALRNDALRSIAMARLEGATNQEIADAHGIGLRAVERKLQLIREKWSRELSG